LLRREPIAAAHHAAAFDIFLIGKVALGGPISAHEALDQDVEFGLTLIAFGWRAHLTASLWGRPYTDDFLLREWVNRTMLCHQQQDDFLLSTTLRRLDYRKIPITLS
jgi:hypothetical protein